MVTDCFTVSCDDQDDKVIFIIDYSHYYEYLNSCKIITECSDVSEDDNEGCNMDEQEEHDEQGSRLKQLETI